MRRLILLVRVNIPLSVLLAESSSRRVFCSQRIVSFLPEKTKKTMDLQDIRMKIHFLIYLVTSITFIYLFFFLSGSFLKELIDKKGFHKLCLLVGYEYNTYELAR